MITLTTPWGPFVLDMSFGSWCLLWLTLVSIGGLLVAKGAK